MLMTSLSLEMIPLRSNLIAALGQVFELKDLGPLNYFLGIQITQTTHGLTLT